MLLISYFQNSGSPATGLSPTVSAWDVSDGSQDVNEESMSEIGGGFYKYDFTAYDETKDYVIRADGGVTLSGNDRYAVSTNETAGVGKILKIEKNKWEIKGNQMIFYDDDGTTPLQTFNLQTKNGTPTERDVFKRVPA